MGLLQHWLFSLSKHTPRIPRPPQVRAAQLINTLMQFRRTYVRRRLWCRWRVVGLMNNVLHGDDSATTKRGGQMQQAFMLDCNKLHRTESGRDVHPHDASRKSSSHAFCSYVRVFTPYYHVLSHQSRGMQRRLLHSN